jgi:hypothetical protein
LKHSSIFGFDESTTLLNDEKFALQSELDYISTGLSAVSEAPDRAQQIRWR